MVLPDESAVVVVYPRVCGGTLLQQGGAPATAVYPRVCGGTLPEEHPGRGRDGLSPRVRGNRRRAGGRIRRRRSIPACAGEPGCGASPTGRAAVYPRVCGGTLDRLAVRPPGFGLSPRVRGNRQPSVPHHPGDRSIPACAGEPPAPYPTSEWQRVYPRVCGGTGIGVLNWPDSIGLSPRVRGNPAWKLALSASPRSIPACAGEPASQGRPPSTGAVYPRVCGGTRNNPLPDVPIHGLSPRVRGNPEGKGGGRQSQRSIPACAGEPYAAGWPSRRWAVYPRVCGGTRIRSLRRSGAYGLSPRVRGNPERTGMRFCIMRSIPACAGEPPCSPGRHRGRWVYPRVCGGTQGAGRRDYTTEGLSPRVRGNPAPTAPRRCSSWSIPACAGEPATTSESAPYARVYPRVCGGTQDGSGWQGKGRGLSPRVRGNRRQQPVEPKIRRSIPACAGEPAGGRQPGGFSQVYPRVCGGTRGAAGGKSNLSGLSPRVRGNP